MTLTPFSYLAKKYQLPVQTPEIYFLLKGFHFGCPPAPVPKHERVYTR